MLRHKPDRRGTAELNGYTARRLNEMALSLSSLARSCADRLALLVNSLKK